MIRLNGARHILSDVEVLENVARDIHTQCGRDYGHAVRDASYHLSVGLGWNRYEVAYYLRTALRRLENDEEAEIDAATTNSPDRVREHCDTLAEALRECASIVQAIGPITRPSFPVSEARRTAAQKQAEDALERLENEGKE